MAWMAEGREIFTLAALYQQLITSYSREVMLNHVVFFLFLCVLVRILILCTMFFLTITFCGTGNWQFFQAIEFFDNKMTSINRVVQIKIRFKIDFYIFIICRLIDTTEFGFQIVYTLQTGTFDKDTF